MNDPKIKSDTNLIIVNNVAKVCKGVPEIDARIFFTLTVLARVSVSQVTLEVGVGDGVTADGTATPRVFEFFS